MKRPTIFITFFESSYPFLQADKILLSQNFYKQNGMSFNVLTKCYLIQ